MERLRLYALGVVVACIPARLPAAAPTKLAILLSGRLMTSVGESLVGVGIIAWEVGVIRPARAGKALALIGTAIYVSLAVGGPLWLTLMHQAGLPGRRAPAAGSRFSASS
ncbi:hypothetical protein [Luteibacter yeojuensis]|uniref:hypothetical protein n=1 Tax=Luteibacter yeojuensis TaxID=345309 RepID=UPI0018DB0CC1|nr:hypothetical protein [Luteibacter yeojuensis]